MVFKEGEINLISFAEFEQPITYESWKTSRTKFIPILGQTLFQRSESEINSIFESWYQQIQKSITIEQTKIRMSVIMGFSLLHYFLKDIAQLKNSIGMIYDLLRSKNRLVAQSSAQVLHWLGHESSDAINLFKEPINLAFQWIHDQKSNYYYNALIIIKKAKRFPGLEIAHLIVLNHSEIIELAFSEDREIKQLAINNISYELHQLPNSHPITFQVLSDSVKAINQKITYQLEGSILILKHLLSFNSQVLIPHLQNLSNKLSEIALLNSKEISLAAQTLMIDIAKVDSTKISRASINRLFQSFITKFNKNDSSELFFNEQKRAIKTFGKQTPLKLILENVQKTIQTKNRNLTEFAFDILKIIFKLFPGTTIPTNLYINAPINKSYIQCLKIQNCITTEIKQYLRNILQHGLNKNSNAYSISISLQLSKAFPLELFDNYENMFQTLIPLKEQSEEKIRCELMETISIIPLIKAKQFLINSGIYDPEKSVRLKALTLLKPSQEISLNSELLLAIKDPSFKVRRTVLKLIGKLIEYNPYDYSYSIIEYVSIIISSIRNLSDMKLISKYSSLLPIIVKYFCNYIEHLIPNIIDTCLTLLCGENINNQMEIINIDSYKDPNSFLFNIEQKSKIEPKRTQIFKMIISEYLNNRDICLIKTISSLGNRISSYLNRALDAFVHIFSTRKSKKVLTIAIKSLSNLSTKIDTGINLRLYNQQLLPILLKLLVQNQNNKVSIAIIKLFGTSFDFIIQPEDSQQIQTDWDVNSKSFYTDFTISHLIPYFNNPTIHLFEAVTRIYDLESKDSAKFVNLVIPMFIKGIDTFSDRYRDSLFSSLEVITRECQIESTEFLNDITKIQLKYLNQLGSIKLAASLSYHLLSSYKEGASILYIPSTKNIFNPNNNYIKYLLQFLTYSILYQDQSIEAYLLTIENKIKNNSSPRIYKYITDSLICLVQNKDLTSFQSRLLFICYQLLLNEQSKQQIIRFIPSLIKFTQIPLTNIKNWETKFNISLPFLYQNNIIKPKVPKIKLYHPIIPSTTLTTQIFSDLTIPDELTLGKWLDNLCQKVINNSPSMVIRSCSSFATTITAFREKLFPIAFLSCWQQVTLEERTYFSQIVQSIINNFQHIDPFFISIIELLDRASMPLLIDDIELAKACGSGPLTLYFLQRLFMKNPKDPQIIEKLLDLNTTMGRHDAAHGILVHAKGILEDSKTALWCELLSEWDKALKLYGNSNKYISSKIRCYSHLEMWDKIIELENSYEKWPNSLKEENAKHFAWANYHLGNYTKVLKYISEFHSDLHLSEILFCAFFSLKVGKYEECEEYLTKGFKLITKDTSVFVSDDSIRLNKNLHYSHVFIELKESLNILKKGIDHTQNLLTEVWNKRLKGFQRNSQSWIHLIAIRSLVFTPGEYIGVYLKMISVLRKERRWNLIDSYFKRLFSQSILPNVELAQSKILWAINKKNEAIDLLQSILQLINLRKSSNEIEFHQNLLKVNKSIFPLLIKTLTKQETFNKEIIQNNNINFDNLTLKDYKKLLINIDNKNSIKKYFDELYKIPNSHLESRIYLTLGRYRYNHDEHTSKNLKEIAQIYELGKVSNRNEYKIWLGWAYTNSSLINVIPEKSDIYSINAINGYLKATQLRTSNTLEYLCQLFSIFFRMKDSNYITNTLISDLIKLPPNIICQIIPQITVQIAHPDIYIRQVVHKILYNFGKEHFQALFYPLRLYKSCDDIQKVSIAKDLLLNMGKKHSEISNDAELFVEGMLRSAISWFEEWIVTLDCSSRFYKNEEYDKMDELLEKQFRNYDSPKCDFDRLFIRLYDPIIQQCKAHFRTHKKYSLRKMWDQFKHLFGLLIDRVKKLELILLPKVSEQLATKRNFKISIPGTYSVEHKVPTLYSIEPALQVLSTQQHPRCVYMISSINEKVKFLLKGNEDIRLDQRVMQFFTLINSLLKHNRTTKEVNGMQITKYAIIPLAPNAGLITWVTGADTLHQMINEHRNLYHCSQSIELEIIMDIVGKSNQQLTTLQKLETFNYIKKKCKAYEIREILWLRSKNSFLWIKKNHNFTITTALISMVGYIIGLGDRHPSNIMVQRETGKVIHIDFGDSFEAAILRKVFPEKVPFRLTRMIVNALDNGSVEGIFRKNCEDVMYVLRESKESIVALLEIFVHEPIEEAERFGKEKLQTMIIDRVGEKLNGNDWMLPGYDENNMELNVEEHVDKLIQQAMDPYRYVSHYAGWCPYW